MKNSDLGDIAAIRERLIELASQSNLICYSDLVPDVLCDSRRMNRLSKVLTQISKMEWEDRKLLLSAIVVLKDTKTPGIGYFEMCAELKAPTDYKDMQQKCFEFWKDENNRKNYAKMLDMKTTSNIK